MMLSSRHSAACALHTVSSRIAAQEAGRRAGTTCGERHLCTVAVVRLACLELEGGQNCRLLLLPWSMHILLLPLLLRIRAEGHHKGCINVALYAILGRPHALLNVCDLLLTAGTSSVPLHRY